MTEQTSYPAGAFLRSALNTLDDWRHLPAYQLERRVDIFFGLLLPEIIAAEYDLPCESQEDRKNLIVVPEFPLRKGLLDSCNNDNGSNQSVKVDFAVFYRNEKRNEKRLFLVELKTDNNSIDPDQLKRMGTARCVGVKRLLEGVVKCALNSKEPRKYAQLIWKLKEIGCIKVPKDFESMNVKNDRPGLAGNFRKLDEKFSDYFDSSWSSAEIMVALIYPGGDTKRYPSNFDDHFQNAPSWLRQITFSKVARIVEDNPLTPFLKLWACCEAGKINPWNE